MLIVPLIAAAALCQPGAVTEGQVTYFEVPLKGEVGKEITAPGVRDAVKAAAGKKASCIVFVIDTPGGRVTDADLIAQIMDRERGGMKYYAIVNKAISAAVWPLSRMDRVFFAPGAATGAAVAFSVSKRSGSAEVDAKLNAALTAEVSSAAELRGQPGSVYRAMMLQSASLYRWRGEGGQFQLGESAPAGAKEVTELDGPGSVLAWTTTQAAEAGFGTLLTSREPASLGEVLGAKEWVRVGDGTVQMTKAFRDIERDAKKVETTRDQVTNTRNRIMEIAQTLAGQVVAARNADPKLIQVFYKESGTLTTESQLKWRRQSDAAINEWSTVQSLCEDLVRAERKAESGVAEYNRAMAEEHTSRMYEGKAEVVKVAPVDHKLDTKGIAREASQTLSRIRSERVRSRV